jgi:hypothetical protein
LDGTPAARPVAPVPPAAAAEMAASNAKARPPFTIMNDPVKSPILETMLQRNCTGKVVMGGIRNHPWYGIPYSAQAVFVHKPDGTPWVKFDKGGLATILAPVAEVGNMLQWTGAIEYTQQGKDVSFYFPQYTVWPDGDNHRSGGVGSRFNDSFGIPYNHNAGTVELTCATEVVPPVAWNDRLVDTRVTPPGDPP